MSELAEKELDARLKTIREQLKALDPLGIEFEDIDSGGGWALYKVWFSLEEGRGDEQSVGE